MAEKTHARTRARSWTLHLLYGWEISGREESLTVHAGEALGHRRIRDRYRPYVMRLLSLLEQHLPEVDATLQDVMPNWRLERLAALDRNILRIGCTEILFVDDVPGKVAIHEGIQLAEKYGGEESPRFVNGVLDAVYRERTVAT